MSNHHTDFTEGMPNMEIVRAHAPSLLMRARAPKVESCAMNFELEENFNQRDLSHTYKLIISRGQEMSVDWSYGKVQ